jgi:hypothetical protein
MMTSEITLSKQTKNERERSRAQNPPVVVDKLKTRTSFLALGCWFLSYHWIVYDAYGYVLEAISEMLARNVSHKPELPANIADWYHLEPETETVLEQRGFGGNFKLTTRLHPVANYPESTIVLIRLLEHMFEEIGKSKNSHPPHSRITVTIKSDLIYRPIDVIQLRPWRMGNARFVIYRMICALRKNYMEDVLVPFDLTEPISFSVSYSDDREDLTEALIKLCI